MRQANEAHEGERKSGFGLNNLIHRMTGGGAKQPVAQQGRVEPSRAQQPAAAVRREPAPNTYSRSAPEQSHDDAVEDDEDLRMEIPAFLRRQAN